MQFYEQLISETEDCREQFLSTPIIGNVLEGEFTLPLYIAFLNQAYHHVRHTVPLLMAAGARVTEREPWVQHSITEYMVEERGHEQWILDDIQSCGFARETFETGVAPFSSEVLVAYLYDYISRKNPIGIFGMVLVLEGTSASLAPVVAKIVQVKLDLPDDAIRYLTSHGELDQDHIGYFENLMNKLTDKGDQFAVIEVANAVYRLYAAVYNSLYAAADTIQSTKAA